MPDYCPACYALQDMTEEIVSARGYVRPLSEFDRRRRRKQREMTAARVEKAEHVGHIVCRYTCRECGEVVIPGVTHVRNWSRPSHWLGVDVPQDKSDRAFSSDGVAESDGANYQAAWEKENRERRRVSDAARYARDKEARNARRVARRREESNLNEQRTQHFDAAPQSMR